MFEDHLDAATVQKIKARYSTLQYDCTTDKKFLNRVFREACGADMWKYNRTKSRWIINTSKQVESIGEMYYYIRVREKNAQLPPFAFILDVSGEDEDSDEDEDADL